MTSNTLRSLDHWLRPTEDIAIEIGRLSSVCGVPLLDPQALDRLLHNDSSICSHNNPRAFMKLRQLAMMHFIVAGKTIEALGPQQAQMLADLILARLKQRVGMDVH